LLNNKTGIWNPVYLIIYYAHKRNMLIFFMDYTQMVTQINRR